MPNSKILTIKLYIQRLQKESAFIVARMRDQIVEFVQPSLFNAEVMNNARQLHHTGAKMAIAN